MSSSLITCSVVCLVLLAPQHVFGAIRGLNPAEQTELKLSASEFTCRDGSLTLARERLNDDYCDCADGSDEPGTSACSNGKFYCVNEGYMPVHLPSSRVWDGLCDCCDGSDEKPEVGCPNTCLELANEAKKSLIEEVIKYRKGVAKQKQFAQFSQTTLQEREKAAADDKINLDSVNTQLAAAEEKKQKAEEAERYLREQFKTLNQQEQEAADELAGAITEDSNEDEYEDVEADVDEDKKVAPPEFTEKQLRDLEPLEEATRQARSSVDDLNSRKREFQNKVDEWESLQNINFGSDNAWYHLFKKCIVADSVEYNYEVCLFDKITQKPKSGGMGTSLGNFDKDDEGWNEDFKSQWYKGGQKCWGGPDRSCHITITCGEEDRAYNPQEPNKCEYSIQVETPMACSEKRLAELEEALNAPFVEAINTLNEIA